MQVPANISEYLLPYDFDEMHADVPPFCAIEIKRLRGEQFLETAYRFYRRVPDTPSALEWVYVPFDPACAQDLRTPTRATVIAIGSENALRVLARIYELHGDDHA